LSTCLLVAKKIAVTLKGLAGTMPLFLRAFAKDLIQLSLNQILL
jgi:hypothetical protein